MRAKASLSIRSSILTSDFISRRLALEPDRSHDVGDPVSPKRYPHGPFRKEAFWGLASGLPDSVSLAEHLRALINLLVSRRAALRSMRANSTQRFFCGLFGDYERAASFEIPAYAIKWCSDFLEIALDCYACHDIASEAVEASNGETDDDEFSEQQHEGPEPDRSFAYMASARIDPMLLKWPHETNGAPTDQLLPRPSATSVLISDLPETAGPLLHVERVLYLLRGRAPEELPIDPQLICLLSTDRLAGRIVRLDIQTLHRLANIGAGFRIDVFQTPPRLKLLRSLF